MTKKEINEIKSLFDTISDCGILRLAGCYVNGEKEKVKTFNEPFYNLPDEEMYKYLEIFRKTLSGTPGKNLQDLSFEAPDLVNFPCLRLAIDCARRGGTAGCVMSAANEEAVHLFLKEKIGFNRIYDLAAEAVQALASDDASSLETILEADRAARQFVHKTTGV